MRVGFTAGEVLCSADLHERCACFGCMSLTTSVQLKIATPQHSSGCGLRGAAGV